MAKKKNMLCSRYAAEAAGLLGGLIRAARVERGLAAGELAERAGISRGLLRRIESGSPSCSMGAVFEVAFIVGVPLFDADYSALGSHRRHVDEKLLLLPDRVRARKIELDDNF